jgi:hypothetical protein
MIDFFDAITKHQYPLAIFIEILNFLGEPRDLDCIGGSLLITAAQYVIIVCIQIFRVVLR